MLNGDREASKIMLRSNGNALKGDEQVLKGDRGAKERWRGVQVQQTSVKGQS